MTYHSWDMEVYIDVSLKPNLNVQAIKPGKPVLSNSNHVNVLQLIGKLARSLSRNILFADIQFADWESVTGQHSSNERLSSIGHSSVSSLDHKPSKEETTTSKSKNHVENSNIANASSLSVSQHSLASTGSRCV